MAAAAPIKRHRNGAGPQRTSILIVDGNPLIRQGIRQVVGGEPDLEVCGESSNPLEALGQLQQTPAELVVVDVSLSGGLELVRRIKEECSKTRVLVCSGHEQTAMVLRCLRAGADGFVSKRAPLETLVGAIRQVLQGEFCFSPSVRDRLLREAFPSGRRTNSSEPFDCLSDRELQVFTLIGNGLTTKQIARDLALGIKTIETHRQSIRRKLSLCDAAQLTHAAVRWVLENHDR